MFSLRATLANRQLPPGYNIRMGIVVLCGRRPSSITRLRDPFCPESVIVHFKSLLPIDNNVNQFIDTQFIAMQRLFAEGSVAVLRGTTEDLSGNMALQPLQNLNVGFCMRGRPTQDQHTLFENRNNLGSKLFNPLFNDDLVVYIVRSLIGAVGNFVGCASHPEGRPGAVVVQPRSGNWLVAHEVGHVMHLVHVNSSIPTNRDFLMWASVNWTNVPPDISDWDYQVMLGSGLTNPC